MSFIIAGTTIKTPTTLKWTRVAQYAEHKTLSGAVSRDYFGSDKNIWELSWKVLTNSDYTTLLTLYDDYILNGVRYFETANETIVIGTLVHLTLSDRNFSTGGSSYLAEFTLTLKEA